METIQNTPNNRKNTKELELYNKLMRTIHEKQVLVQQIIQKSNFQTKQFHEIKSSIHQLSETFESYSDSHYSLLQQQNWKKNLKMIQNEKKLGEILRKENQQCLQNYQDMHGRYIKLFQSECQLKNRRDKLKKDKNILLQQFPIQNVYSKKQCVKLSNEITKKKVYLESINQEAVEKVLKMKQIYKNKASLKTQIQNQENDIENISVENQKLTMKIVNRNKDIQVLNDMINEERIKKLNLSKEYYAKQQQNSFNDIHNYLIEIKRAEQNNKLLVQTLAQFCQSNHKFDLSDM